MRRCSAVDAAIQPPPVDHGDQAAHQPATHANAKYSREVLAVLNVVLAVEGASDQNLSRRKLHRFSFDAQTRYRAEHEGSTGDSGRSVRFC